MTNKKWMGIIFGILLIMLFTGCVHEIPNPPATQGNIDSNSTNNNTDQGMNESQTVDKNDQDTDEKEEEDTSPDKPRDNEPDCVEENTLIVYKYRQQPSGIEWGAYQDIEVSNYLSRLIRDIRSEDYSNLNNPEVNEFVVREVDNPTNFSTVQSAVSNLPPYNGSIGFLGYRSRDYRLEIESSGC